MRISLQAYLSLFQFSFKKSIVVPISISQFSLKYVSSLLHIDTYICFSLFSLFQKSETSTSVFPLLSLRSRIFDIVSLRTFCHSLISMYLNFCTSLLFFCFVLVFLVCIFKIRLTCFIIYSVPSKFISFFLSDWILTLLSQRLTFVRLSHQYTNTLFPLSLFIRCFRRLTT